jgi:hypothetical protein
MRRTCVFLCLLTALVPASASATPVLFTAGKVNCQVVVDGAAIGVIKANGFLRADLSPGQHVVDCTGTYTFGNHPAVSFSLYDKLLSVSGNDQVVFGIAGRLAMQLRDIAKAIGGDSFVADFSESYHLWFADEGCHMLIDNEPFRFTSTQVFPNQKRVCGDNGSHGPRSDNYLVQKDGRTYLVEQAIFHQPDGAVVRSDSGEPFHIYDLRQ